VLVTCLTSKVADIGENITLVATSILFDITNTKYVTNYYSADRHSIALTTPPADKDMGKMRPMRLRLVRLGLRVISAFTLPQ